MLHARTIAAGALGEQSAGTHLALPGTLGTASLPVTGALVALLVLALAVLMLLRVRRASTVEALVESRAAMRAGITSDIRGAGAPVPGDATAELPDVEAAPLVTGDAAFPHDEPDAPAESARATPPAPNLFAGALAADLLPQRPAGRGLRRTPGAGSGPNRTPGAVQSTSKAQPTGKAEPTGKAKPTGKSKASGLRGRRAAMTSAEPAAVLPAPILAPIAASIPADTSASLTPAPTPPAQPAPVAMIDPSLRPMGWGGRHETEQIAPLTGSRHATATATDAQGDPDDRESLGGRTGTSWSPSGALPEQGQPLFAAPVTSFATSPAAEPPAGVEISSLFAAVPMAAAHAAFELDDDDAVDVAESADDQHDDRAEAAHDTQLTAGPDGAAPVAWTLEPLPAQRTATAATGSENEPVDGSADEPDHGQLVPALAQRPAAVTPVGRAGTDVRSMLQGRLEQPAP